MPVPTVAPTPNIVSWKTPIVRLSSWEAPCATGAPRIGRRRSICSVKLTVAEVIIPPVKMLRSWSEATLAPFGEDGSETIHCPVDFSLGDDDRRREPKCRAMGVLDQDAALGQQHADLLAGAARGIEIDPGPEAVSMDGEHAVTDQIAKPAVQVVAEFG